MLTRLVYSRIVLGLVLTVLGPIGGYVAYQMLFVLRVAGNYPELAPYVEYRSIVMEAAFALAAIAASTLWFLRTDFRKKKLDNDRLSLPSLICLTAATACLMIFTIYRLFGTDIQAFIDSYSVYYRLSRSGSAWAIWAGYGVLMILLIDMFKSGVDKTSASFFLLNCAINFTSGGRQILVGLLLTFCLLVYLQRPSLRALIAAVWLSAMVASFGFGLSTLARTFESGGEPSKFPTVVEDADDGQAETSSYDDLNYNSAFILADVVGKVKSGEVSPSLHVLNDLTHLASRVMGAKREKSNSETRAFYPQVGKGGTTISMPLKANLVGHFGIWAYYLDWLVVGAMQILFMMAAFNRGPHRLLMFTILFWGCAFSLIARGGILSASYVIVTAIIVLAYFCHWLMIGAEKQLLVREESDASA